MHTENSIHMAAPADRIFRVAADVSGWPEFLPHYRWVRYLSRDGDRATIQMAAKRGLLPVQWTAELWVDTRAREIHFQHVSVMTRGMKVVWSFDQTEKGVLVRIRHDLPARIPLIGPWIDHAVIGKFFVSFIAQRTLAHMKRHVESLHGG
jgi:ribosome-associated toxin RatA of RatAB toxin-antitoxin module